MQSEAPTMKIAATRNGKTEATESGVGDKSAGTLGSQVSISFFLGLVILTVFGMSSIGLGDNYEKWDGSMAISILIGAVIRSACRRQTFISCHDLICFP